MMSATNPTLCHRSQTLSLSCFSLDGSEFVDHLMGSALERKVNQNEGNLRKFRGGTLPLSRVDHFMTVDGARPWRSLTIRYLSSDCFQPLRYQTFTQSAGKGGYNEEKSSKQVVAGLVDVSGWLGAGIAVVDHQIAHICPQPDLRYRPLGANQAAKQLLSMKNAAN